MDRFLAFSTGVKHWVDAVLGWIASALLIVLTLFALLEIVRRYLFGVVFEWGQDAMILGMVSAVAIYFCVTQVRRSHLVMNAVVAFAHSRGWFRSVGVLKMFVSLVIAVFCGAIGITGWSTLSYALDRDLTSYSLLIPLWPFYLTMMAGFLLMSFIALLQLGEDIISFARGEHMTDEIELTTDV